MKRINNALVNESDSLKKVMKQLDRTGYGIAIVVDKKGRLKGVVTDGDIRRSVLKGTTIKSKITLAMNKKPIYVMEEDPKEMLSKLTILFKTENVVGKIPVVNKDKKVVDMAMENVLSDGSSRISTINQEPPNTKEGKILVVGGAGYIGSVLIKRLLRRGYEVKVLDQLLYDKKLVEGFDDDNFEFIKGDTRDIHTLINAMKGCSAVIHLAELVGDPLCAQDAQKTKEINLFATNLIGTIAKYYMINRFIYISSCHDTKTRLVTKRGLVNYKDIKMNDVVFTLNKKGILEEKSINKIMIFKYKGKIIHSKGKRLDFCVTPDHNIWYESGRGHLNIKTAGEFKKLKSYAKLFESKGHAGKKTFDKIGSFSVEDFFLLAGMFIGDGYLVHTNNKGISKSGLVRSDYLKNCRGANGRFKKGGVNPKPYSHPYVYMQFAIPNYTKDEGRGVLITLLNKYNIKFNESNRAVSVRGRTDLNKLFEQFGRGAHNKNIPGWMLAYPQSCLRQLFRGLMLTDGSKIGDKYHTVSRKLMGGFVELCFKIGLIPNVTTRQSTSGIKGRKIHCRKCYTILITKTSRNMFCHYFSEQDYEGDVWCLNVPNGNFLVERNMKYTFLGNCSVYGSNKDKSLLTERSRTNPLSIYAQTKLESEKALLLLVDDAFSPCILRLGTVYGVSPRMRFDLVVNVLTARAITEGKITINGGSQYRPNVHVVDVCRAITIVLEAQINKIKGEIFNVGCESQNYQVKTLGKFVKNIIPSAKLEFVVGGDERDYRVSFEKIRDVLGFRPIKSIKQGIKEIKDEFSKGNIKNYKDKRYRNL